MASPKRTSMSRQYESESEVECEDGVWRPVSQSEGRKQIDKPQKTKSVSPRSMHKQEMSDDNEDDGETEVECEDGSWKPLSCVLDKCGNPRPGGPVPKKVSNGETSDSSRKNRTESPKKVGGKGGGKGANDWVDLCESEVEDADGNWKPASLVRKDFGADSFVRRSTELARNQVDNSPHRSQTSTMRSQPSTMRSVSPVKRQSSCDDVSPQPRAASPSRASRTTVRIDLETDMEETQGMRWKFDKVGAWLCKFKGENAKLKGCIGRYLLRLQGKDISNCSRKEIEAMWVAATEEDDELVMVFGNNGA